MLNLVYLKILRQCSNYSCDFYRNDTKMVENRFILVYHCLIHLFKGVEIEKECKTKNT